MEVTGNQTIVKDKHHELLGIAHIIVSSFLMIPAFIVAVVLISIGFFSGEKDVAIITYTLGVAIAGFLILLAIPGIIGGIALLQGKSWAKPLLTVVATLQLLNTPFGTILAIYTFWVLYRKEQLF